MKRTTLICSGLAACACVAVAISPAVGSRSATGPLSPALTIVYDTNPVTHQLVFPRRGHGLSPRRGALRQDPGGPGMYAPGDNRPYRISKVLGRTLLNMTADQMVATLKRAMVRGQYGAEAHLVTIDELLESFGDPGVANPAKNAPLPPIVPTSPGARLTDAMQILASQQSPWGGTWASRVQVYIAPGIVTSIAVGDGPNHNLSPSGRQQYRTWRVVMPALALAGGVHLEMYHGSGSPLTAFSASLWRKAPAAFLGLFSRYHGSPSAVHFVFSATTVPAGAPSGYGDATEASWSLARSTTAGRTILRNGPDEYRLGNQATQWLLEYNRQFPA